MPRYPRAQVPACPDTRLPRHPRYPYPDAMSRSVSHDGFPNEDHPPPSHHHHQHQHYHHHRHSQLSSPSPIKNAGLSNNDFTATNAPTTVPSSSPPPTTGTPLPPPTTTTTAANSTPTPTPSPPPPPSSSITPIPTPTPTPIHADAATTTLSEGGGGGGGGDDGRGGSDVGGGDREGGEGGGGRHGPPNPPAPPPGGFAQHQTTLREAVRQGDTSGLRRLLEAREGKVNLDVLDAEGQTALHESCQRGDLELVKLLVRFGANVRLANRDGWSAVHIAAFGGHSDILLYLMTAGNLACRKS